MLLQDKIWFTYKARIRASQRLESNDLHSQVILILYAFSSASLSVISIKYPDFLGVDTALISAIFSLALLTISMLVANRDYRGRAIEMKRNYVAIQTLYNKLKLFKPPNISEADAHEAYVNLLGEIENHLPIDDKYFRVFEKGLQTRLPSCKDKFHVLVYVFRRFFVLSFLYLMPAIVFVKYWPTT